MTIDQKPGNQTTEYEQTRSSGRYAWAMLALAASLLVARAFGLDLAPDSLIQLLVGGGASAKAIAQGLYTHNRSKVKAAAAQAGIPAQVVTVGSAAIERALEGDR